MTTLREGGKAIVIGCPPPFECNNNKIVTLGKRFDTDEYEVPLDDSFAEYVDWDSVTNGEPVWEVDELMRCQVLDQFRSLPTMSEQYLIPLDDIDDSEDEEERVKNHEFQT